MKLYLSDSLAASLSSNYITAIAEDSLESIWVGTERGLNRINRYSGEVSRHPVITEDQHSVSDGRVTSLFTDARGRLWVGTLQGLFRFSENGFISYPLKWPDKTDSTILFPVRVMYQPLHNPDELWIGTTGLGMLVMDMDKGVYTRVAAVTTRAPTADISTVWSIYSQGDSVVWMGTPNGLIRWGRTYNQWRSYQPQKTDRYSINDLRIRCVTTADASGLWIGTSNGGLNYFDMVSERFYHIGNDPDNAVFFRDYVNALIKTSDGTLWVGTHAHELYKISKTAIQYKHYATKDGLPHDMVRCFWEDIDSAVWVGTENGVARWAEGQFSVFPVAMSNLQIRMIYRDRRQNLWIGSRLGGIWRQDANKTIRRFVQNKNLLGSLSGNRVYTCYEDTLSDVLWVGTYKGGLNRFDYSSARFELYRYDSSRFGNSNYEFVNAIALQSDSIVWLGTRHHGLIRFDVRRRQFRYFSGERYGAEDNHVYGLCIDRKGYLWVATGKGLQRWDMQNLTPTVFTVKDGLANDMVYSVQEDLHGRIWLTNNNGLTVLRWGDENQKPSVTNFSGGKDLPIRQFEPGSGFRKKDGTLLFGGVEGFIHVFPESVEKKDNLLRPYLTRFEVFQEAWPLDTVIDRKTAIVLPYDKNFFTFQFSAIGFQRSDELEFEYLLEGLDRHWVTVHRGQRDVSYANIRSGEYFFTLRAKLDGAIVGMPARIKVIVQTAWWDTILFRLSIIVIVLISGAGIFRMQSKRMHKRNKELRELSNHLVQARESERLKIAREIHDELGQSLAVMKIEASVVDDDHTSIIHLIDEAARKVQSIALELRPAILDDIGLSAAIAAHMRDIILKTNIHWRLDINDVEASDLANITAFRIFQECVTNILRHSNATEASVTLSQTQGKLFLTVDDNGSGIDEIHLTSSKSIGLIGMRERIRAVGGHIFIKTAVGQGTHIRVELPSEPVES
ncbi:ATP-binding protein [bacterium]|nr:ATP-binding protein [bacterium]